MKKLLFICLVFAAPFAFAQKVSFKVKTYGSGQPVILIPGLGCSGEVWDETVREFKDHYKLYVLTLPGFAGVRPIDTPMLRTVKDQLIRFVQEKGLARPVLIGHSLGGFLCLWAASDAPGLFSKVICVDGLPFLPAAGDPGLTVRQVRDDPRFDPVQLAARYDSMTSKAFRQDRYQWALPMVRDPANAALVAKWNEKSDRRTLAFAYSEMCTTDLRNDLARINIPVLVLGSTYGTEDNSKKIMEDEFRQLPQKMIVIAPTRHFIMLDDPSWFKEQVKNFLVNGLFN